MKITGKVHKYGDNIDTDVIIPARYLNTTDPQILGSHCLEDLDAEFVRKVKPGDVIIAGENFGCGSSREHAPVAIKSVGVSAVLAKSFARIFFRNAINTGLPLLICPEAVDGAENGDILKFDLEQGLITNKTKGKTFEAAPFPDFLRNIISVGGLVAHTRNKLGISH